MFVVDIFETGRLGQLGVKKQPFEAQIIAVSFFVLDIRPKNSGWERSAAEGWAILSPKLLACRRVSAR